MLDLQITNHASARMRQRGFRKADVELVINIATRVGEDVFFVKDQDAAREIEKRKHEIQQLERLRGAKVIVQGDVLITLYHVERKSNRTAKKIERNGS
jgi:Domain of unknown function (DUF4258)